MSEPMTHRLVARHGLTVAEYSDGTYRLEANQWDPTSNRMIFFYLRDGVHDPDAPLMTAELLSQALSDWIDVRREAVQTALF